MKLIRWGERDNEKPGIMIEEKKYDVSAFGEDYNEAFFASNGLERLKRFLSDHSGRLPELNGRVRLGAPVCRPSKIICIGLNYAKHAAESGMPVPKEPVLFMKATTALSGPNDNIVIPRNSEKTDWEVELAFIIGKKASYVHMEEAMDYVAGYCLHNDVSEREWQLERGGTWDKGKGCDTFAPMGPVLATVEEIADPHKLRLWLKLNGQIMQESNTDDLIFDIPYLVSYLSSFMTLLPGDIISTGTPAGVGLGQHPPRYLKEGDMIELGIDGLGVSTQYVRNYSSGYISG